MTQEEYNFVTLIINSLSALGTFTASGIALWIALRQTRMQLKENAKIKITLCKWVQRGGSSVFINLQNMRDIQIEDLTENLFIQISIYNRGIKDFYLKAIAFASLENYDSNYLPDSVFHEKYSEKQVKAGSSYALHIPLDTILTSLLIVEQYRKLKKPKKSFQILINTTMESVFWAKIPLELHMYFNQIVRITTPGRPSPQG